VSTQAAAQLLHQVVKAFLNLSVEQRLVLQALKGVQGLKSHHLLRMVGGGYLFKEPGNEGIYHIISLASVVQSLKEIPEVVPYSHRHPLLDQQRRTVLLGNSLEGFTDLWIFEVKEDRYEVDERAVDEDLQIDVVVDLVRKDTKDKETDFKQLFFCLDLQLKLIEDAAHEVEAVGVRFLK